MKYITPSCQEQEIQPIAAIAVSPEASMEGLNDTNVEVNWFD